MEVPTRITVPISFEIKGRIEAIVRAHPITNPAAVARAALEAGLREVERAYPPALDVDMRLRKNRDEVR